MRARRYLPSNPSNDPQPTPMAKTILITGASTGIGAATARALAAGNTLFLHYNQSQAEAEAVGLLGGYFARVFKL